MKSKQINKTISCRLLSSQNNRIGITSIQDNRPSFHGQTSLIAKISSSNKNTIQQKGVIQLAVIDEWFEAVRKEIAANKKPTITLYSEILQDGFGDAGQLGFLNKEMHNELGDTAEIIPYASYQLPLIDTSAYSKKTDVSPTDSLDTSASSKKTDVSPTDSLDTLVSSKKTDVSPTDIDPERKKKIIKLAGIKDQSYLIPYIYKYEGDRGISGQIAEAHDSWEIQYPVPAENDSGRNPSKILKIYEMGKSEEALDSYKKNQTDPFYHTGNEEGIGYGIPSYTANEKSAALVNLLKTLAHDGLNISNEDQLRALLSDAWLVKLNDAKIAPYIINRANEENKHLLIFIGNVSDIKSEVTSLKSSGIIPLIYVYKGFEQDELTTLMSFIGSKGKIIAGGEGMFVHALGASQAPVMILPQQYNPQSTSEPYKYKYQLDQLNLDSGGSFINPLNPNSGLLIKLREVAISNNWFKKYIPILKASAPNATGTLRQQPKPQKSRQPGRPPVPPKS